MITSLRGEVLTEKAASEPLPSTLGRRYFFAYQNSIWDGMEGLETRPPWSNPGPQIDMLLDHCWLVKK